MVEDLIEEPEGEVTRLVPVHKIDTLIAPFINSPSGTRWYAENCITVEDDSLVVKAKRLFFTKFIQRFLN